MNPKEVIAAYRLIERAARDIAREIRRDTEDHVHDTAAVDIDLEAGAIEVEYERRLHGHLVQDYARVSLDDVLERIAEKGWPRWSP